MNVQQFMQNATKTLSQAGIDSARLDVLILLEDVLGKDRSHLLAHTDIELPVGKVQILNNYITQRQKHIPLAYIRGRAPFFGRDFMVNTRVLVPRPETESVIEVLKEITLTMPPVIVDVGCGSGCIGVTAAMEVPGSTVHFYDIDKDALGMASRNAHRFQVRGQYYFTNLLEAWYGDYDIVLANLPYIPNGYPINKAAGFEPRLALFSGNDGLDHYRLLWKQIASHTPHPQHVIIESLPEQHHSLTMLAGTAAYTLHATHGYVQHFNFKA
jgi:release factor glutamine methyltransferase